MDSKKYSLDSEFLLRSVFFELLINGEEGKRALLSTAFYNLQKVVEKRSRVL